MKSLIYGKRIQVKEIYILVYRTIREFSFDEHTRRDLAQEIMLKLQLKWLAPRSKILFPAWLDGVVKAHCLEYEERVYNNYQLAGNYRLEKGDSLVVGSPEKHLKGLVKAAVAMLPDYLKIPIEYHYYFNLSFSEISALLDLPENRVKARTRVAEKRIKRRILRDSEVSALLPGESNPLWN